MKTKKRKLNVKLLRRIQKHILDEPRRFVMERSILKSTPGFTFNSDNNTIQRLPSCGTAACIAGWAVELTTHDANEQSPESLLSSAAKLLNVEETTSWVEHPLFYTTFWPSPFRWKYLSAKTPKARAKIVSARIEYLIKTGE